MAEDAGSRAAASRHRDIVRFAPAGALVVLGLLLFGSTGRDDAYITYWPADVLAESGRILNYNGQRLEQSSSLLHTVLLAALSKLSPLSTPAAGWVLGVAGGLGAALIAVVIADRIEKGAGWVAGLLVATTGYIVYWSFGGLDTPLAATAFLVAILALARLGTHPRQVAVATLGVLPYVLVRPEAPVVLAVFGTAALGVALLSRRWPSAPFCQVSTAVRSLVAIAIAALIVVAFRIAYFGDVVPQPVHVKVSGLRLGDGFDYARHWLWRPDTVLLVVVALLAARRIRRSELETFVWLGAGVQLGFVVATGGDWMEAGRFFVPFLSVIAVLAAIGLTRLPLRTVAISLVVVVQLVGLVIVARTDSTGRPLWASFGHDPTEGSGLDVPWYETVNRVHARDAAFVPKLVAVIDRLHAKLGRRVVVATGQAGMVMYYTSRERGDLITFIDRGRLTGDAFGRCSEGLVDSQFGRVMPYSYWFAHVEECGVPLPDVIFELGDFGALRLGSQYVVVDEEPGGRIVASGRLPGDAVDAAEFVAVRADILSA